MGTVSSGGKLRHQAGELPEIVRHPFERLLRDVVGPVDSGGERLAVVGRDGFANQVGGLSEPGEVGDDGGALSQGFEVTRVLFGVAGEWQERLSSDQTLGKKSGGVQRLDLVKDDLFLDPLKRRPGEEGPSVFASRALRSATSGPPSTIAGS